LNSFEDVVFPGKEKQNEIVLVICRNFALVLKVGIVSLFLGGKVRAHQQQCARECKCISQLHPKTFAQDCVTTKLAIFY